jgi:hypothetical protein
MGVMAKLRTAVVILPGDFSEESGGYLAACQALGLRPGRHGHAIYLVRTSAGSLMLVNAELGEPAAVGGAERGRTDQSGSHNDGGQHGGTAMFRGNRTSTGTGDVVEIRLTGDPIVRVVVNVRSGALEGVGVSNIKREAEMVPGPGVAKPEGEVEAAVREAVADVLAETLVGAIWPVLPSTGALKNYDSLYRAAESLLQPQMLLLKLINASARAAAHAAGLGIVAPLIGQMAEDLCAPLLRPSPQSQAAVDMVKIIDIELYAEGDQLAECPALRGLAIETVANVIGTMLEARPGPRTAEPEPVKPRPCDEPSVNNPFRDKTVPEALPPLGPVDPGLRLKPGPPTDPKPPEKPPTPGAAARGIAERAGAANPRGSQNSQTPHK